MYKAGIIGCGRTAGLLENDSLRLKPCTHAGAYISHPKIEIVSCADSDKENLEKFSKQFNISNTYDDYRDMLKSENLDIVSIAAYAPERCRMVLDAVQIGKVKVIFCEKALSVSLNEAEKMIKICKKHGVHLIVNHTRRWDWHYIYAKQLIDNGKIGKLQSINAVFSGNLVHTGTHMFDLLRYFAGDPVWVMGKTFDVQDKEGLSSGYKFFKNLIKNKIEDKDGAGYVQFQDNVFATVHGVGKKHFIFELDIHAKEGRIRIGNGLFEFWKQNKSEQYEDFSDLYKQELPENIEKWNAWNLIAEDIVYAICDNNFKNRSSGKDAKKALEMALAFYVSEKKKNPVYFPLKGYNRYKVASR